MPPKFSQPNVPCLEGQLLFLVQCRNAQEGVTDIQDGLGSAVQLAYKAGLEVVQGHCCLKSEAWEASGDIGN